LYPLPPAIRPCSSNCRLSLSGICIQQNIQCS
jgi:hypothetical protein